MTDETAVVPDEPKTSLFFRLAAVIAGEALGPGAKASLRRNDPATVLGQPAFHQALAKQDINIREEEALAWAAIVQAIALTSGNGFQSRSGKALAEAGLSEVRFSKLMAASGDMLIDQIGILARHLAAKQVPVDWTDLANLLLADHRGEVDEVVRLRFRIAQGYYRELNRAERPSAG
ncbi:type I-E CRISPR-associated protein Cse2/CasB [Pleomorphomonas sp. NRK KF1]|uniref:type I-E CRISPR-associated protein Cse2/CasB n=1 Tax=Pleomorphomonas sp. NRK KF1 TaxID=2943000 RepID=UPI0020449C73|nr:type I-E CRISPR-associated protein Cse2/CasB [Pleomorphomonas sp. NRK KF1]MCM5552387.1 type I-E CRISPR-associated protein Cse2/CasB [Pleomorphomonas sp. NRK KF1]